MCIGIYYSHTKHDIHVDCNYNIVFNNIHHYQYYRRREIHISCLEYTANQDLKDAVKQLHLV